MKRNTFEEKALFVDSASTIEEKIDISYLDEGDSKNHMEYGSEAVSYLTQKNLVFCQGYYTEEYWI
ncbi:hypothetical protein [Lactococcus ileimucosae]|uniref:hypothetical protein n=1 Tax=Lactococcus ileimucosae TaxID=2941329 RepID=UPI002044707F|nr:hypothetical protein [Lactococcus ileimucosae]